MIDPAILVLLALAGAFVFRDYRSINNLRGFFDSADDVLGRPEEGARIADDIALMSRTVLNPRRSRQMALMAIRGHLSRQMSTPGPRISAFSGRWDSARYADRRAELLRRFVWELTRASLGFGAVFGVWLLWRRAQFWDDAAPEWAVLAALGLGMRAGDGS